MNVIELLAGGSRQSTGASDQAAQWVLAGDAPIEDLMAGMLLDDAVVRSRSAHALMLICGLNPKILQPHKRRLLNEMAPQTQWEVRQQFCKIITALTLDEPELAEVLKIFETYLEAPQSFVRTAALQGLADLVPLDESLRGPVTQLLQATAQSGTAAMRARSRKLLTLLAKQSKARK